MWETEIRGRSEGIEIKREKSRDKEGAELV